MDISHSQITQCCWLDGSHPICPRGEWTLSFASLRSPTSEPTVHCHKRLLESFPWAQATNVNDYIYYIYSTQIPAQTVCLIPHVYTGRLCAWFLDQHQLTPSNTPIAKWLSVSPYTKTSFLFHAWNHKRKEAQLDSKSIAMASDISWLLHHGLSLGGLGRWIFFIFYLIH